MDNKSIVKEILSCLGGDDNIAAVTNCMTRLRVTVKTEEPVDVDKLKNTATVLGLVHDRARYYEVVVGPGTSRKYADICHEMGFPAAATAAAGSAASSGNDWKANKEALKKGQKQSRAKAFLKIIGDIFVPLLPGIIAAGLCAGFASLITQIVPGYADSKGWNLAYTILTLVNQAFMTYITAWAGYRAAERFGATPILGGMLGMITSLEGINTIAGIFGLFDESQPLMSILRSGKGGVLAVICGVLVLSLVEKKIRKHMPASIDIILTPILTLLVCIIPYVLVIMPVFGLVSNGIVWVFSKACMSPYAVVRLITGYVASALFLPMVAAGMHHGMVALYSVQLQAIGYVTLYPALAMAGAGQVGASIALLQRAKKLKHDKMCSVIKGALPAGFLGVGEPLIYGVTLPMGRPFISAGIGAGFGGAFVMLCQVASTTWGPSGLLGAFVMTGGPNGAVKSIIFYLIGLVISYIMSYIVTRLMVRDRDVAEALGGIPDADGSASSAVSGAGGAAGTAAEAGADSDNVNVNAAAGTSAAENTEICEPTNAYVLQHSHVSHGEPVAFGFGSVYSFEHVVADPLGIHVRPAGEIAQLASGLNADITVACGDKKASAGAVIQLMGLGAKAGSVLTVTVSGADAQNAAARIKAFMDEKL